MPLQLIDPATWVAQPWANGAGVTHELLRVPAGIGPFALRVSVAEITRPAPFSPFVGYQRWLYLLDGGPVTLAIEGRRDQILSRPADGVQFAGDATVAATAVAQPSRDLNFIVSSSMHSTSPPQVCVLQGPVTRTLDSSTFVVVSIAGDVEVGGHLLPRHGCAWRTGEHGPTSLTLARDALAAVLELEQLTGPAV
ncbi:MAG: HutD family protein [Myxococcales bacterium]|nr:HutD family protein [Myxococcales bacterium]